MRETKKDREKERQEKIKRERGNVREKCGEKEERESNIILELKIDDVDLLE